MSGGGKVPRTTLFGAMVLGSLLFVACSGSAASAPQAAGVGDDQQAAGEPAPAPTAAPAFPAPAASPGSDSDQSAADAGTYIVRTGTLDVEVADVDAAVTSGRNLVASIGGYVSASDESMKGDQQLATITYRIPVDQWQDTITALRAIGTRVISENTQAEEVTAQVVDLNARIANAQTSEASLRDIMARAGTIDDVLNVQTQLQSVEEDIEVMEAQQQDLTGRAALGTLAVTWETPVVAAVAEVQSGWNLGTEIDHALAQTVSAGQALASFLIWVLLVGVPVFGPMLLIALFAIWFVRRYQRRHPRPVYAGWQPVPGSYAQAAPQGWYPSVPDAAAAAPGSAPAAASGPVAEEHEGQEDGQSRPPEVG